LVAGGIGWQAGQLGTGWPQPTQQEMNYRQSQELSGLHHRFSWEQPKHYQTFGFDAIDERIRKAKPIELVKGFDWKKNANRAYRLK